MICLEFNEITEQLLMQMKALSEQPKNSSLRPAHFVIRLNTHPKPYLARYVRPLPGYICVMALDGPAGEDRFPIETVSRIEVWWSEK